MNTKNRFARISCTETRDGKKMPCYHYHGDMQVDVPNTVRLYCPTCKSLVEYTSDGNGLVTKERIARNWRSAPVELTAMVG